MPVAVREDGHVWGAKEGLPNFVKVKIPGVAAVTVEELISEQLEDGTGADYFENGERATYRRRRWRVLVSDIPAQIRQTLLTTGEVTVTPAQIRNYIRRVRDNAQFGGL